VPLKTGVPPKISESIFIICPLMGYVLSNLLILYRFKISNFMPTGLDKRC